MKKALVNEELSITYPNAFRDMELTELQLAFGVAYKNMWGIRDEKHHAIIAVIWKEANAFLQKLVSTTSLTKQYEKGMRKALGSYNYALDGFFTTEVANLPAEGFRYSYERDGVGQTGEAVVFRRGRCSYTLYYYTQTSKAGANRAMYEDLLASLTLN